MVITHAKSEELLKAELPSKQLYSIPEGLKMRGWRLSTGKVSKLLEACRKDAK